jgi:hypothetical protein
MDILNSTPSQRIEKRRQTVMIELLHQSQQTAYLPFREALAGKPVQIMPWQVGNQPALVFAIRHGTRHQELQIFGIHPMHCAKGVCQKETGLNAPFELLFRYCLLGRQSHHQVIDALDEACRIIKLSAFGQHGLFE